MKSKLHQELQDRAIKYMYDKSYWITRQEVPISNFYCDVWGVQSKINDYNTMAIEVKVSKNDFRSRSQKYKEFRSDMANEHYILCPSGLIFPDQVHPSWGLLWWGGKRLHNKKKATFIKMTDTQKLDILMEFLSSKLNKNKL